MGRVRVNRVQFCAESGGKVRHVSQAEAELDARRAQRRDPVKSERYWYQCEACRDWHTSRYREYRPRVDDGSETREQPGWRTAWERAARGEVVRPWPKPDS